MVFELLKDVSEAALFRAIPKDEFPALLPMFKLRQYHKNHQLIFENDQSDEIYCIRSGMVKVYRMRGNQELIFNFHLPGDVVGEVEAIIGAKDHYRMASVEAIEPVTAWVLAKSDLLSIIDRYPDVLRSAYLLLTERLQVMNRKLRSLAFGDTRAQCADLLLDLCYNCGAEQADGWKIQVKLSQNVLADMLGLTRESVSKIVNEFKRDGILSLRDRHLHIHDMTRLQAYCDDPEDRSSRKWHR